MAAACGLVQGLSAGQVIADRAYDAHQLHDVILDQGGKPVIPPAAIADISTLTTKSLIGTAGASKAFSPNSSSGGASLRAMTNSPPHWIATSVSNRHRPVRSLRSEWHFSVQHGGLNSP